MLTRTLSPRSSMDSGLASKSSKPSTRSSVKKRLSASFPLIGSNTEYWSNRRSPLNVGIHRLQDPVQVAARERLKPSSQNLDVLLRHRLLRQPGGFEGVLLL